MRKMKAHLKQKRAFVKRGYRTFMDPRARIVSAFDLIKQCFEEGGFSLESDSAEFEAVKFAVLMVILESLFAMSRMRLWDDLQIAKRNASESAAGRRTALMEKITSARDRLRGEDTSQKDIVWAMDVLDEAVKDMAARFAVGAVEAVGTFVDNGYEHDRYKCAALLPTVTELMAKVWLPLRLEILHPPKKLR